MCVCACAGVSFAAAAAAAAAAAGKRMVKGGEEGQYRSHVGSRYKLGCCGHAGLFDLGSIPPGCLLLGPWGVWFFPKTESLRLLNPRSLFHLDSSSFQIIVW